MTRAEVSHSLSPQLEQAYQLEAVRSSWEVGKKAPTKSQLEKLAKTGEPSVQFKLQSAIESSATDCPTLPDFLDRLHLIGIETNIPFTRNGKVKGISYALDGVAFQGNQLGSAYSFPGLQKYLGVNYEPERDDKQIQKATEKEEKAELTPVQSASQKDLEVAISRLVAGYDLQQIKDELESSSELVKHWKTNESPTMALAKTIRYVNQIGSSAQTHPQYYEQLYKKYVENIRESDANLPQAELDRLVALVALKKRSLSEVKSILQHSPIAQSQGDEYVQDRLASAIAQSQKPRLHNRTYKTKSFGIRH